MADNTNDFKNTVEELFKGMDSLITSKTVVGDAIHAGDAIILPLMDVTFAVGAGAGETLDKTPGSGGGMGGKMSPCAVLVIRDGTTKMVSVKNQDSISKIIDMVPDFVNKFTASKTTESETAAEE